MVSNEMCQFLIKLHLSFCLKPKERKEKENVTCTIILTRNGMS